MKRFVSVLLTVLMIIMLAVPVFAADTAKFRINVVSETDNEISITIDYEGGATFSCYDYELKYNAKKLSVKTAFDGAGFDAFSKETKMNGGAIISTINSNSNPIKGTCATTEPFKVVNGKDLAVINFKKLSSDKVSNSDISLVFTNCQTADFKDVKTVVESDLSGKTDGGASNPADKNTAADKTDAETDAAASKIQSTGKDNSEALSDDITDQTADTWHCVQDYGTDTAENEDEIIDNEDGNSKKVIVVAAAAVCMLFIIAAVCVYIVKKAKKDDE